MPVARDYDGIERAAGELLAEMFLNSRAKRRMADGYYPWVTYLQWLHNRMELGKLELRADEMEGIAAVERARAEFQRKNPRCPQCGQHNSGFMSKCRCGQELRRSK
jgi:hypothetical protein